MANDQIVRASAERTRLGTAAEAPAASSQTAIFSLLLNRPLASCICSGGSLDPVWSKNSSGLK